jgi:NADH-quinone oxidoreductase subunit G
MWSCRRCPSRRVQRFYPAVLPRPEARPDFAIIGALSQRLGLDIESLAPARIFTRLAAKFPAFTGLDYRALAQVTEQWPVVGRSELYYSGAAYDNRQGLGVQLPPAAQKGALPELSWPKAPHLVQPDGTLLAVPVNRLYDRGITIQATDLLHPRTAQPYLAMNPAEAERMDLFGVAQVNLKLGLVDHIVALQMDEGLPAGVVLVPRSMGLPLQAPTAVTLTAVVKVSAVG